LSIQNFPKQSVQFLKKNVLFKVSIAAKLQAEMTKTKTQAELHCSRELQ